MRRDVEAALALWPTHGDGKRKKKLLGRDAIAVVATPNLNGGAPSARATSTVRSRDPPSTTRISWRQWRPSRTRPGRGSNVATLSHSYGQVDVVCDNVREAAR